MKSRLGGLPFIAFALGFQSGLATLLLVLILEWHEVEQGDLKKSVVKVVVVDECMW